MTDKKVKVGIVVDDYKLKKFLKTLKKEGFSNFKTHSFTKFTTSILIKTTAIRIGEINVICNKLEKHFTALKN